MKLKRIVTATLGLMLAFCSVFASACKDKNKQEAESSVRPALANTLHEVKITEVGREFVRDAGTDHATTEYVILSSSQMYQMKAANFIASYMERASGAKFTLQTYDPENPVNLTTSSKYIIVGCTELFNACGYEMPDEEKLGASGYYIKSHGDSVFLMAPFTHGYQKAALAFMRAVTGYDMLDSDCVIFESNGATLPDLDIVEAPDFAFSNWTNWMPTTQLYAMGYDPQTMMVSVNGYSMHNCLYVLPVDKYLNPEDPANYHPEWYSSNMQYRQLCYTAHGDPEAYELMLQACFEPIRDSIDASPEMDFVTLTQMDAPYCCECDACNAVVAKDGGISATLIRFMNDLEEKIRAHVQENYEKREVVLCFFAYHVSLTPPSTSVEEDPTLKCNDNVCVIIAPIHANYTIGLDEGMNDVYAQGVVEWSKFATKIMSWVYECNYHYYLFPHNTYSAMIDTYYFLKQNNTFYMYNEGQRKNKTVPCFGSFKDYINSKAQFDVTVNYNDLEEKFFTNYFMDAKEPMLDLFDQMTAWMEYLQARPDNNLDGGIYQALEDEKYWPKQMVDSWLKLVDEAYLKVEKYKTSDPTLYEQLCRRINTESIFMRYLQCTMFSYTYSVEDLRNIRTKFKEDCISLDIYDFREHNGDMSTLYSQWGIA